MAILTHHTVAAEIDTLRSSADTVLTMPLLFDTTCVYARDVTYHMQLCTHRWHGEDSLRDAIYVHHLADCLHARDRYVDTARMIGTRGLTRSNRKKIRQYLRAEGGNTDDRALNIAQILATIPVGENTLSANATLVKKVL